MIKKVVIIGIVLAVIGGGILFFIPWGNYESKIEKSDIEEETTQVDEEGNTIPSLDLIEGEFIAATKDSSNAELLFDVDGLKATKGAFEEFEIALNVMDDFTQSELNVQIASASINTNNGLRDEHLVDEDFFHVEKYPTIIFESNAVELTDTGYVAKGNLTLLETVKPIDVPFKHLGSGVNKMEEAFEAFEGGFVFDRTDYGMEEVSGAGNIVTVSFYCELIAKSQG